MTKDKTAEKFLLKQLKKVGIEELKTLTLSDNIHKSSNLGVYHNVVDVEDIKTTNQKILERIDNLAIKYREDWQVKSKSNVWWEKMLIKTKEIIKSEMGEELI